ncbi:alpha/beta hydrolase [Halobacteriales archaeon SW_5_70_135]|nr:MAG: alpha/beta hydrolase [Halobacteriales archaeon SW_5_70_135]
MSEEVTLTVGGSAYPGRVNEPDEPTGRGVLVVPGTGHGPFGDVFLRFARRAADEGYTVARFETWLGPDDLKAKDDDDFRADLEAGVEFLRERGPSTVAVVAKSFGGRLALEHPQDVERMVLWAPAVVPGDIDTPEDLRGTVLSIDPADLSAIDVPVRVLHGEEDALPLDSPRRLAEHLPRGELVALPDEDHSFLRNHERTVEETVDFLPA